MIGGVDVGGVLPKSCRGVGVAAGVSPGDRSLVRMDGGFTPPKKDKQEEYISIQALGAVTTDMEYTYMINK
jgi:hypothetical protein